LRVDRRRRETSQRYASKPEIPVSVHVSLEVEGEIGARVASARRLSLAGVNIET
jgi:hypothetical protein